MSNKHPKKLKCICKNRTDRYLKGTDRQKHTSKCPLAVINKK